ncbi:hypothetical protein N7463_006840 [Penicillium fimorum]|uniref:F-box domain-containing protein n=1 Tax=Penicillium fimorum TaxID=1882269 RepID=A0A9W9XW32_9EURO|nr:hypothetical protein N7463_006840 [Penicillium fimorum]
MATPMPRGYHSATEYSFNEEQTDTIVQTASYHRRDHCLSVIWYSPREHIDICQSIATPFQRTSNVGLGSLDRLPVELLHDTLSRLNMRSLFRFRQINLTSRQMVDSLHKYQMVVLHGLNLFCALVRTRLAISLFDFYNTLSWRRCCFKCLQDAPEIQVHTFASVKKQFQLTRVQLTSFKSLPGTYTMNESKLALKLFQFIKLL